MLDEARSAGLEVAKMKNRAGEIVEATPQSIEYALMELGGRFDSRLNADLVDPYSSFGWPIAGKLLVITLVNRFIRVNLF